MRNLHLLIPHLRLSSYIDVKIAFQDEGKRWISYITALCRTFNLAKPGFFKRPGF